jgi:hypothetical protein
MLVEKWKLRIAELDRQGNRSRQASLWPDERLPSSSLFARDKSGDALFVYFTDPSGTRVLGLTVSTGYDHFADQCRIQVRRFGNSGERETIE